MVKILLADPKSSWPAYWNSFIDSERREGKVLLSTDSICDKLAEWGACLMTDDSPTLELTRYSNLYLVFDNEESYTAFMLRYS